MKTGNTAIGLLFRPGSRWLGGFYYLQNLALAVGSLPQDERRDLVAFVGAGAHAPAEEMAPGLPRVPYRAPNPRRTVRTRGLDVLRRLDAVRRSEPWGLAAAARRSPVAVVFPHFEEGDAPFAGLPWIPDLQHLHLPEYFSEQERAARTAAYGRMLARAPRVVVSSETAARELEERFPGARERLRVLRFTTVPRPEWTSADPAVAARRYGVARPYLMLPNQLWVHKNHITAFDAVRRLRDAGDDVTLVCTGAPEDYRHPDHPHRLGEYVGQHGLAGRIRLLGVVPREDYFALLRGAAAVVQPSRFEGWSSTVEDARALGRPLVLSDIPVHREQDPAGARYARPDEPEAFAEAIRAALASTPERDEAAALAGQRRRVAEYARTFVAIADEAAG